MHPLGALREYRDEPLRRLVLRARLIRPYWRRRFFSFGDRSILHKPDWIYGAHQIHIGEGVVIFKGAWLAAERRAWPLPKPVLRIGDRVMIRSYCTISAAEGIVIEDDVVVSSFSTVIDSDHLHSTVSPNVVWGGRVATSPIRIGRGTWIGERVSVLRGSDIGEFCTIGANSVVKGSIPDYSIAVGAPARVVGSTRDQFE